MGTEIKMVIPRICGTCVSCNKQRGRYRCLRLEHTFSNGDEFTSVCDEWKQGVLLSAYSVQTDRGKEPDWLTAIRIDLQDARETSTFYYELYNNLCDSIKGATARP